MQVSSPMFAAYRPQPKMAGDNRPNENRQAIRQGVSKSQIERIGQNVQRELAQVANVASPTLRALARLRVVEQALSDVSDVIQAIPVETRGTSQQFDATLSTLKTQTREVAKAISRGGSDYQRRQVLGVFQELASRNPIVAENAAKTLRAFGLRDEAIADIRTLVGQVRPAGPVRFSAKLPEERLADYADMILVENPPDAVLNILADHQANKILDLVFGAGAYVVIGYDKDGWPIIEWQNHVI